MWNHKFHSVLLRSNVFIEYPPFFIYPNFSGRKSTSSRNFPRSMLSEVAISINLMSCKPAGLSPVLRPFQLVVGDNAWFKTLKNLVDVITPRFAGNSWRVLALIGMVVPISRLFFKAQDGPVWHLHAVKMGQGETSRHPNSKVLLVSARGNAMWWMGEFIAHRLQFVQGFHQGNATRSRQAEFQHALHLETTCCANHQTAGRKPWVSKHDPQHPQLASFLRNIKKLREETKGGQMVFFQSPTPPTSQWITCTAHPNKKNKQANRLTGAKHREFSGMIRNH